MLVTVTTAKPYHYYPYYTYSAMPAMSSPLMTGTFVSKKFYAGQEQSAITYNKVWNYEGEDSGMGKLELII